MPQPYSLQMLGRGRDWSSSAMTLRRTGGAALCLNLPLISLTSMQALCLNLPLISSTSLQAPYHNLPVISLASMQALYLNLPVISPTSAHRISHYCTSLLPCFATLRSRVITTPCLVYCASAHPALPATYCTALHLV